MTAAVAVANIALGLAYCGYGVMTFTEMRRNWRSFGFSHFGLAWILMAFTCGPHHLFHGFHVLSGGQTGGAIDLAAVLVGLPVGVMWLYLRVESFFSGRGDRFVPGTPRWLRLMPVLAGVYLIVVLSQVGTMTRWQLHFNNLIVANVLLVVLYCAIGWFVTRTQLSKRPSMGGWSVSGLCLSAIFPTCAMMHAVWALYALGGVYRPDIHSLVTDWLSVPAACYFLWVVRELYRGTLRDWNEGPAQVRPQRAERGADPQPV